MEGQATDGGKQWSLLPRHTLLLQSRGQVCDDLGASETCVFCTPEEVWQCLQTLWVVTSGGGVLRTSHIQWAKALLRSCKVQGGPVANCGLNSRP